MTTKKVVAKKKTVPTPTDPNKGVTILNKAIKAIEALGLQVSVRNELQGNTLISTLQVGPK